MNNLPIRVRCRFHNCLTHCRVRMNRFHDFMACGFQLAGGHDFGDHFSDIGSNHVGAKPLAILGVKDYLHKTVGMSGSFCFSRSREGELAHLDLITGIHSRSEEHTSELKSLMRISYAVFCLKKKTKK